MSVRLKLDVNFEFATSASEIGPSCIIIICLRVDLVWRANYIASGIEIDLRQVIRGERQCILWCMVLNRLRLIKDVFKLGLLELEMLFLKGSLFTVCGLGFILACGACKNETLADIRNIIIIQVLGVVLFYLRSCPTTLRGAHIADECHPLRYILRLIDHCVLQALVL